MRTVWGCSSRCCCRFRIRRRSRSLSRIGRIGLGTVAPGKLYLSTMWPNQFYDVHPMTLRAASKQGMSHRLGMRLSEAKLEGRHVFWGLLDRGNPPATQKPWPGGAWSLHLKASRVEVTSPEIDFFDGVR